MSRLRISDMADAEGTNGGDGIDGTNGAGGWFMVEAIVEQTTGYQVSSDEDENSIDTGEDLVDFIDNTRHPGDGQEVPLELFVQQNARDDAAAVQALKRKYTYSPATSSCVSWVDCELSPRLNAISLDRGHERARRRLFDQDSGYGHTQVDTGPSEGQVPGDTQQTDENVEQEVQEDVRGGGDGEPERSGDVQQSQERTASIVELLKTSNLRATLLSKFKELYGLAFGELVRQFKSDKSVCGDWVVCAFGVYHAVAEAIKTLIQPVCLYAHIQSQTCSWGMVILMLIRFKCSKSRETVAKCIGTLLNVPDKQMLIEPPKIRSAPCALYWFRTAMGNASEILGETPEWITRQTVVGHAMQETQFSLSVLVQWAYDNDIVDESDLAYQYAMLGNEDPNAAAFLASNCQAKYIKDAITMCKYYKRAEQKRMSMAQWIAHRSQKVADTGDWRPIVRFLRYQKIEFVTFMSALKMFLRNIPKKSCIVIYGPSDTGKSLFCMSLLKFLGGAVISYVNSTSHFWLSPLTDAKVGLLDDATYPCWVYIDTHLRSVLDGNQISIDRKHKNLTQIQCPPLFITTNINPLEDANLKYLHSRIAVFHFMYKCPLDDKGDPVYQFNNENWKSFFQRSWAQIEGTPEEEEEEEEEDNGNTGRPFRCVPGETNRLL